MIDFFEFSNEMLCVADRRGYFIRVNQAWTKTLGWSVEELTCCPYIDFVHPDDLEATVREGQLLRTNEHETIRFENRYRCRDGSYRWLAWQSRFDPESHQLVATARDVTNEKVQAEALREVEARFTAFMDNSPAIAWSKDQQGRIVFLNKTVAQQLNLSPAEWYGKTDFDIWPAEVAKRLQANDRRVLESGQPIQIFEETGSAEREHRYWTTVLFPYQDRLGQTYVGGIAMDISEIKQAEAGLKAKQELLRNLIEVQDNEKQRLCQEFHDGLIQYAVGAMKSLEGYQRDANPTKDSAMVDRAISDLRKGIEDGRRTIQGIRPAVLDDSDLNVAIYDLIDDFSDAGILVTFVDRPELGRLTEPVQTAFYRVAQEALNNARKYSGTDVIRIELRQVNGELELEVSDFGCGFDVALARKQGFGLLGMTERMRVLGGECSISSESGLARGLPLACPCRPSNSAKND